MIRLLCSCLLLSSVALSGCDLIKKLGNKSDSESAESEDSTSKDSKKKKSKGKASSGCSLPEGRIASDLTLEKGCKLEVDASITVSGGATLSMEPGVELAFAPDTYLSVEDAKLVIKGTEKEPVVLTSKNASKAKGDWVGIFFAPETQAGTRIEHARIQYAGQEASLGQGAITIQGTRVDKRIAIVNSTFAHHHRAAIVVEGDRGKFAEFANNRIEESALSLKAPMEVLSSIGPGNTFKAPLETSGRLFESATWPAFGVAVHASGSLAIGSREATPTLTLAKGTTMKFAPGSYLSVGEDKGGALVAPGCTFTSSADTPLAGDWVGLFVYKLSQRLDLAGSTIEAAGNDSHGGRAAITFYDVDAKDARGVQLANLTIKNTKTAALASPNNDCAALASQVTVSDIPACRAE